MQRCFVVELEVYRPFFWGGGDVYLNNGSKTTKGSMRSSFVSRFNPVGHFDTHSIALYVWRLQKKGIGNGDMRTIRHRRDDPKPRAVSALWWWRWCAPQKRGKSIGIALAWLVLRFSQILSAFRRVFSSYLAHLNSTHIKWRYRERDTELKIRWCRR